VVLTYAGTEAADDDDAVLVLPSEVVMYTGAASDETVLVSRAWLALRRVYVCRNVGVEFRGLWFREG
jgi:hypothetical protein